MTYKERRRNLNLKKLFFFHTLGRRGSRELHRKRERERERDQRRKTDSNILVKLSSLCIACCAIYSSDLLCRVTDEREDCKRWRDERGGRYHNKHLCQMNGIS